MTFIYDQMYRSARLIFLHYSPSGFLDEIFYSLNEILIAHIDCSTIYP